QGFLVRSSLDIENLRAYCDYVYIDVTKGRAATPSKPSPIPHMHRGEAPEKGNKKLKAAPARPAASNTAAAGGRRVGQVPLKVKYGVYRTVTPMRKELVQANRAFNTLKGNLNLFAKQLTKGKQIDYDTVRRSVNSMVDSVLRCPDAFTWLMRLRRKDQESYDHSLRSALWAVQFARFIGTSKEDIQVLCTATLLKDIGKMRLPKELLKKSNRSPEEEHQYRRFVEYGVEMLRNTHQVEAKVISVVRHHCERFDGSGYPEGLIGSKIPLLAQMCGIASVYDAISNPRESAKPVAASRAISLIYNMRDRQFREDMVLQFIQSIGLYPTGTMVELTTGDIGVVVEQDPDSRLTPKIALLANRQGDGEKIVVDLKDQKAVTAVLEERQQLMRTPGKVAIARDLEPARFDFDVSDLTPEFLQPKAVPGGGVLESLKERLLGR
ncbi:MAG: HD domain-containing protein, partial [Porticoccaceae bacterium]|nr:HD domain-containing protein [Porticoccaceae bacterium]